MLHMCGQIFFFCFALMILRAQVTWRAVRVMTQTVFFLNFLKLFVAFFAVHADVMCIALLIESDVRMIIEAVALIDQMFSDLIRFFAINATDPLRTSVRGSALTPRARQSEITVGRICAGPIASPLRARKSPPLSN